MKSSDYDKLWLNVISAQHNKYINDVYSLKERNNSKRIVFELYNMFIDKCKKEYMYHSEHIVDRHKVCACMMYALVEAHSLDFDFNGDQCDDENFQTFNEKIAITTGLSMLRAFVIASAKKELPPDESSEVIRRFDDGVKLPENEFINHGEYIENFAVELYFTRKYRNYNILSLAHSLYLLELFTRTCESTN